MVNVVELGGAVDVESSGSGEMGAVVRRTRTRRGWKLGDAKGGWQQALLCYVKGT